MGTYTLASQRKSVGSGSAKLAAYKAKVAASSAGKRTTIETPAEYRAKAAAQKTAPVTVSSAGITSTASLSSSPLLQKLKEIQSTQQVVTPSETKLVQYLIGGAASTSNGKLTPEGANYVRSLIGSGYVDTSGGLTAFQAVQQNQNMINALKEDLYYRQQRIALREQTIQNLSSRVDTALATVKQYDKYISNGEFTGTQAQYNNYIRAYNAYSNIYNSYSATVEAQNLDVATYNKNKQNITSKSSPESVRSATTKVKAAYTKVKDAYNTANVKVSGKLPTIDQAEPYIRQFVKTSTPAGLVTRTTDSILGRKDTSTLIDFYLGGYESVQQKPLKAAATFTTFFVGGVVLKGMGAAAKVLGAGTKTAKAASYLEKGLLTVYVLQSGKRVVTATDARELGYVTGDIIFNELLPAGLGIKYGLKVVNSVPKGTRVLKGTGTKAVKTIKTTVEKPVTYTKAKWQARKLKIRTMNELQQDRQAMLEMVANYRKNNVPVPNWITQELRTIGVRGKSGALKSQSTFQKFLADTSAEASMKPKTRQRSQQLKTVKKTVEKTETPVRRVTQKTKVEQKYKDRIPTIEEQIQSKLYKKSVKSKIDSIDTQIRRIEQVQIGKRSKTYMELKNERIAMIISLKRLNSGQSISYSLEPILTLKKISVTGRRMTVDQLQKIIQTPTHTTKQITEQISQLKQVTKTATKTKTRRQPTKTKTVEKVPEIVIPKLPSLSLTKKQIITRKTTTKRALDERQFKNAVGNIKDIFG